MKPLLLALMLAPLFSYAQTLALVDRKLMAPMKLADNLTIDEVQSDLFPVYLQDLDTVIQTLETYRRWVDNGRNRGERVGEKVIGSSSFFTDVYNYGPRERYRIVFTTKSNDYRTSMVLINKDLSARQAIQTLTELIDYLRNNLAVVKEQQGQRPHRTPGP